MNQASYVEQDCIIEHEGRKFESGGAAVTDQWLVGYLGKGCESAHLHVSVLAVMDWQGAEIGTYRVLSSWFTPRNHFSRRMYSVECFVSGVRYVGRSCGSGMVVRAKRSPRQG